MKICSEDFLWFNPIGLVVLEALLLAVVICFFLCGYHHSRFLRLPSWVGIEMFKCSISIVVGKKWIFTRKDPLLLTPGASERVPLEGVGEVGQLKTIYTRAESNRPLRFQSLVFYVCLSSVQHPVKWWLCALTRVTRES